MRTDSLIALKIGQGSRSPVLTALRPVLERALTVIADALQAVDSESQRAELSAQLNSCREAIADDTDPEHLAPLTQSCFDLCEQALQALQSQQQERRSELRRLVVLVRETVALLVGDGDAL